ncbi:MAG: hypothetical protein B6I26_02890 [Desulfobacteraceae bacterium 4572_130]|nr:MAG: hypothetical protein B6I26_02890 [Desulfobacteraceae bacterium 4572_130]
MRIQENIYNTIREMNINELTLLHEQIRLLKKTKTISINKITGISGSCWADTRTKETRKQILDIILPHLIL